MLGLFIVLPVLALHAQGLTGGTDRTLVGFAFGAYGLTQAVLQIPFGWLSDRFGRKPILALGLTLFALGSFVAASAGDIQTLIAGRILQGGGAISSVAIAFLADVTRPAVRTRGMAVIGITIAFTFLLSLVAGPPLAGVIGVSGIFVLTGALALSAIGLVALVRTPAARGTGTRLATGALSRVLGDPALLRLDYGIFALHAVLVMVFLEIPGTLAALGITGPRHWTIYLPVMIVSFALVLPVIRRADRPEVTRPVFIVAVSVLLVSQVLFWALGATLAGAVAALVVFFTAFNLLEAKLPSLVSKLAPADTKGTAAGVFGSVQFFGMFVGGVVGGLIQQHFPPGAVFLFGFALVAAWLVLAIATPSRPAYNPSLAKSD